MTDTNSYSISHAEYVKLQTMAKLALTDEEKQKIHAQLDEALKAVKVFDELKLDQVPPLAHPGNLVNIMRDDHVTASFSQEEALANAPESYNGFFMVSDVLSGESNS